MESNAEIVILEGVRDRRLNINPWCHSVGFGIAVYGRHECHLRITFVLTKLESTKIIDNVAYRILGERAHPFPAACYIFIVKRSVWLRLHDVLHAFFQ